MFILAFLYFENNALTVNNINVELERLPQEFNGYTIVQLSDLHGKYFGKNQENLVRIIRRANPDLIVYTGDLIDSRRYNREYSRHHNEDAGLELMRQATKIAPVYYVPGNHEWRTGDFTFLEKRLRENKVRVLRNSLEEIKRGQSEILIMGIDDPTFHSKQAEGEQITADLIRALENEEEKISVELLGRLMGRTNDSELKILLAHRPELFPTYSRYDIDLIFSGHFHGGQVRVPFKGGLIAPNQGLFPRYTAGKYKDGNSTLIVSRGLGNSIFPQRLFNRPEVVVVNLKSSWGGKH